MTPEASPNPFELLRELDRLGRQHRPDLPEDEELSESWFGIGFRLGGRRYVVAMGEVTEILTCPATCRVPNARHWVRGVANVRGNLLPVVDLSGYLDRGGVNLTRLSRVLVIPLHDVMTGLLVDEVLGMRRFAIDAWRDAVPDQADAAGPYLQGIWNGEDGDWPQFSMQRLAGHPAFLKAAG